MKHLIFRHYGWLGVLVAGLLIYWIHANGKDLDLKLTLTVIGSVVSGVFLVQKQKLEELKMFKDLFREFNQRYDQMNEMLNSIVSANASDKLTAEETKALFDYFNLCGEEYLFYKRGYIDPLAWQAWYNGMKCFHKDPRINELWEQELKSESYYGFVFRD